MIDEHAFGHDAPHDAFCCLDFKMEDMQSSSVQALVHTIDAARWDEHFDIEFLIDADLQDLSNLNIASIQQTRNNFGRTTFQDALENIVVRLLRTIRQSILP